MDILEIEKQIKSIPGNEPVLEKLYALLDSGEAIAFVGAGASAGLWPLWDKFLSGLVDLGVKLGKVNAEEAAYLKKEASNSPLETAQELRNKIGDKAYFEFLFETFKDAPSPVTKNAFTPAHQALMQLPIHNYVTLNYDAGLTNARSVLYPKATTSYCFWNQEESRRIKEKKFSRLVLHAHGRYDWAESIVLTLNDYRKTYSYQPYLRLMNELFGFEKLLFVGFGMTDPYIKQLSNNINADYKSSELRHIAIVGLNEDEIGAALLIRNKAELIYGAHILFYPTKDNHKALTEWLATFAEKYSGSPQSKAAEEIVPLTSPAGLKKAIEDKFVHKPTDDDNYKGRTEEFAKLNRWGNDPATRAIAITGIGGQGKTSLVGRWLKQERSPELKTAPIFYWSFYEDLDVVNFLKCVVEFCLPIVTIFGKTDIEPISFIIQVVQQARILLVLDGLEVLQEDAENISHGRINHPLLEQFLAQWLKHNHKGLMILTSRFRFPQLERYSGVSYHNLNLTRLSKEDGIDLLEKLKILGKREIKGNYIEKLHGHPLAIRVLASAIKRGCHNDLSQFKGESILTDINDEDNLGEKLKHLLDFYENQLKDGQKELLSIVSLFKRPVEQKNFLTLLARMKSLRDTPLAKANSAKIEQQLNLLVDDFLVEKTKQGITTHPVIRDHFRNVNNIKGSRKDVADYLQKKPGSELPQTLEEIRDLVEAVQLLCDEGEFEAAHNIYRSRLSIGGFGFNVFRDFPALTEGLDCELAIIGNENQRNQVEQILGIRNLAFHYTGVGLFNFYLGNLFQALKWWNKNTSIRHILQDSNEIGRSLWITSYIELTMGNIIKASQTGSQALTIAIQVKDSDIIDQIFANGAYLEFLRGSAKQAYGKFTTSLFFLQKRAPPEKELSGLHGNQQSEFFLRIDRLEDFQDVNDWNINRCNENKWNKDLAICNYLQGWYEICVSNFSKAEEELKKSEKILQPSGLVGEICRLDWVWGLLFEAKGDYLQGLQKVNDSLYIATDKGFRLWHADGLVLRGRLYLMQFIKEGHTDKNILEKANDDAQEALTIAEQTGYIWPKVEALELLASYHQTRSKLPGCNSQEEKEKSASYAAEAAELKKGLYLTDADIKEAKKEAKEEFDKITAGWEEKKNRN